MERCHVLRNPISPAQRLGFLFIGVAHTAYGVDALPGPCFASASREANDFEIGSSRMAVQKSTNENVRAFANRMIAERTDAAGILAKARSEAGITLAPTPGGLEPRHTAVLSG